jgi:hypothetical protein
MDHRTAIEYLNLGWDIALSNYFDDEEPGQEMLETLDRLGLTNSKNRILYEYRLARERGQSFPASRYPGDLMEWIVEELLAQGTALKADSVSANPTPFEDITSHMPPGVYSLLPELCQRRFYDAGRCLDHNDPTAAVTLLTHAVELMVRHFHGMLFGSADESLTWDKMETKIRELAHDKAGNDRDLIPICPLLKDIRLNHRIPVTHRGEEYDFHVARIMFYNSVDVVMRMVWALERRHRPKGIA